MSNTMERTRRCGNKDTRCTRKKEASAQVSKQRMNVY